MSAMVLNTAHSFNINIGKFLSKMIRSFHMVGYARAAAELTRLGYHEEAQNCIKLMKSL